MNELEASGMVVTAKALAMDAACAQVVAEFRAVGVDSILLKGPTIADWLYPGEARGYGDADLLVDPENVIRAAAVLSRLGFAPFEGHVSLHAHPWRRGSDGAEIDLHVTIWGPHRPAAALWRELQQWTELRSIGSTPVRVLTPPARALHIVLHAAQHQDVPKPRQDLRRALERLRLETWLQAERLADRLWALAAMAEGLLLEPAGRELLSSLALARAALVARGGHAPLAVGFARLGQASGCRAKLSVVAEAVVAGSGSPNHERGGGASRPVDYARGALKLLARSPQTFLFMCRSRWRR